MTTDIYTLPSNPINEFEEFFHLEELDYRQEISNRWADSTLEMNIYFDDILRYAPALAYYLQNSPRDALLDAKEAVIHIMRFDKGGFLSDEERDQVHIAIVSRKKHLLIDLADVNFKYKNKLICVTGMVNSISERRAKAIIACYECPLCHNQMDEPQLLDDDYALVVPNECTNPNCNRKRGFLLLKEESQICDYQVITIQQLPEETPAGIMPHTMKAILPQRFIKQIKKFPPGTRVKIFAIVQLRMIEKKGRPQNLFRYSLLINSLTTEVEEKDLYTLTQEDIKEIQARGKLPDCIKILSRKVSEGLYDVDLLAHAALYSMMPANRKITVGGKVNHYMIHVLFAGDPGVAKSEILFNAAKLTPKAKYTTAPGASAAGLTAGMADDPDHKGQKILKIGLVAQANESLLAFDEADKAKPGVLEALHTGMQNNLYTRTIAGYNVEIRAETAMLFACNPKKGHWNIYEDFMWNVNLSSTILDRFDLIFVVRERHGEKNRFINKRILEDAYDGEDPVFEYTMDEKIEEDVPTISDEQFMKHQIYCNKLVPQITDKTILQKIEAFINKLDTSVAEEEHLAISKRKLKGIIRLLQSNAKWHAREIVELSDWEEVRPLIERSLADVGKDETGKLNSNNFFGQEAKMKRKQAQSKYQVILSMIKEIIAANPADEGIAIEDIWEPMFCQGLDNKLKMTKDQLQRTFDHWIRDRTLRKTTQGLYQLVDPDADKKREDN